MKAKMHKRSWWIKDIDPERLRSNMTAFLLAASFGILGEVEHYFSPYGYTCLWLLSESHLAIHTFPEEEKTYVELSSCIEKPFNIFCSQMKSVEGYL